jgi:hypothetical protein
MERPQLVGIDHVALEVGDLEPDDYLQLRARPA